MSRIWMLCNISSTKALETLRGRTLIPLSQNSVDVQLPKLRESVTIETLRKAVSSATSSLKLPSDLFMFKLGLHSLVQIFRVGLKTFKAVLHDSRDTF